VELLLQAASASVDARCLKGATPARLRGPGIAALAAAWRDRLASVH
jgi:hypothetical protein